MENIDMDLGKKPEKLRSSFNDLINKIDTEVFNYSSAEKIYKELMVHYSMAEGHIDNNLTKKDESREKFNEMRGKKSVNEMMKESKVAPTELFDMLIQAYRSLDEVYVWQRLQIEVLVGFAEKLFNEYMTTKTFEIHNAVETGFEKRQEEWMNLVKENTKTMFTNYDGKIDNLRAITNEIEKKLIEFEKYFIRYDMKLERYEENSNKINNNKNDKENSGYEETKKPFRKPFPEKVDDKPEPTKEKNEPKKVQSYESPIEGDTI